MLRQQLLRLRGVRFHLVRITVRPGKGDIRHQQRAHHVLHGGGGGFIHLILIFLPVFIELVGEGKQHQIGPRLRGRRSFGIAFPPGVVRKGGLPAVQQQRRAAVLRARQCRTALRLRLGAQGFRFPVVLEVVDHPLVHGHGSFHGRRCLPEGGPVRVLTQAEVAVHAVQRPQQLDLLLPQRKQPVLLLDAHAHEMGEVSQVLAKLGEDEGVFHVLRHAGALARDQAVQLLHLVDEGPDRVVQIAAWDQLLPPGVAAHGAQRRGKMQIVLRLLHAHEHLHHVLPRLGQDLPLLPHALRDLHSASERIQCNRHRLLPSLSVRVILRFAWDRPLSVCFPAATFPARPSRCRRRSASADIPGV